MCMVLKNQRCEIKCQDLSAVCVDYWDCKHTVYALRTEKLDPYQHDNEQLRFPALEALLQPEDEQNKKLLC